MEPLKDILLQLREAKGYSREDLEAKTGIPNRYIEYLEHGEYYRLPPDAYVYGYIRKLSLLYQLDVAELWEQYKREKGELKRSGAKDVFPGISRREEKLAGSGMRRAAMSLPLLVGVFVAGYILWQAGSAFLRSPDIEIVHPADDIHISEQTYAVRGTIDPRNTLTINGEAIIVDVDGGFEREYVLQEGINEFTFRVRTLLGKEGEVIRRIVYEPQEEAAAPEDIEDVESGDAPASGEENTNI